MGCVLCNSYIKNQNIEHKKKKIDNNIEYTKRVMFRLSIILFYPLYLVCLLFLYIVELLTEDEPFK